MTNKAKLAFDLLEQEMEVIYKDELVRFTGGSGSYTYEQLVAAINSGDLSNIPAGTYVSSGGMFTYYEQGYVFNNGTTTYGFSISSGGYFDGGNFGGNIGAVSQPPTDCFFQCLGWISAMNGDTVHDANYYAGVYAFTHPDPNSAYTFLSGDNSSGGMPANEASSFASIFFNTTNLTGSSTGSLANWINPSTNPNGDRQLIGIYRTPSGGLHAINVLSISGNEVSFWDPQKMMPGSVTMSQIVSLYGITAQ